MGASRATSLDAIIETQRQRRGYCMNMSAPSDKSDMFASFREKL
jgi:hypothetical protein